MNKFTLEYDINYGIAKRKGWSVSIDGIYYVTFWPEPITAILWAFFLMIRARREQ